MKIKLAIILGFLLCSYYISAQEQITVTGTVIEASTGDPAIGVTVVVKGTSHGTVTDIDGNYTLTDVPANGIIVFSYIGMTTVEEPVNSRTIINVTVSEDVQSLEEVVVIGYGTSKVKDLTSSITTIRTEDIMKTPTSQPMQALQGKVPGLQIVSSGSPGSSPTVRVRGIGSYPGRGNESPLYVVDGVFYDDIGFLNSADINSISILKDASASAIYGVRAANGVILIETKTGQLNRYLFA